MGRTSELHIQMQDELIQIGRRAENGEITHLDAVLAMREEKKQLEQSIEIISEFERENIDNIANEASKYPDGYNGNSITIGSRTSYSFRNIPEITEIENQKKSAEQKYKAAFDGFQKGIVQTSRIDETNPDSPLGWIGEGGEILPFPEVNNGKSFVTVKQLKK